MSETVEVKRVRERRRYAANPHAFWVRNLRSKYGIDPAEYARLFDAQGGRCAICRRIPDDRLAVDHDHETGAVRGLLCRKCNLALGHFDLETLRRAVAYLVGIDPLPQPWAKPLAEMRGVRSSD